MEYRDCASALWIEETPAVGVATGIDVINTATKAASGGGGEGGGAGRAGDCRGGCFGRGRGCLSSLNIESTQGESEREELHSEYMAWLSIWLG